MDFYSNIGYNILNFGVTILGGYFMKSNEHVSNEPFGLASLMEKISAFKNMSLREKLQNGIENLRGSSGRLNDDSDTEEDMIIDSPISDKAIISYNSSSSRYNMTDNKPSSDDTMYNTSSTNNTNNTRYSANTNRYNTTEDSHSSADARYNTTTNNLSFTGKIEPVEPHKNRGKMTRNLENLFGLDRSNLLSSDHTTAFYKSTKNKIIIFEKDISEIPCTVTIKDGTKVYVYTVKYKADYTPILYPAYDEKEIDGEVIYMDNEEIWYKDFHKLTLGYNNGTSMEFHVVRMSELPGVKEEDLIPYVKRYFAINRSPKMSKLVKENALHLNNIVKMSDNYLIYRHVNNSYSIYVYSYAILGFNEIKLERLPAISMDSYDTLLSPEILRFILENKFPLEEFEEKNGYIEYTKEIGRNRITLMRFKL